MQPRDQRQTLMDLLGIDFSKFDKERTILLQQKGQYLSQVNSLETQIAEFTSIPNDTPDQEVSAGNILQRIQEGQQAINEHQKLEFQCKGVAADIEITEKKIQALEDELERLRVHLRNTDAVYQSFKPSLDSFQPPDLTTLQEQLNNIEHLNRMIRMKQQQADIDIRWRNARSNLSNVLCDIDSIDQDKRDALEAAKFPVSGLTFDESGVLFQGVPLKQASSAEQIRVSLAIGIAMNPSLKFLIIRDGSLLDTRSRELIANMAAKHDMQVFIEAVDESGSMGFVISDGMVQAPVETIAHVEPGQQVLA